MLDSSLVSKLVALALEEDLAFGDCTSDFTIRDVTGGVGALVCKESLIVCGLPLVPRIVTMLTSDFTWRPYIEQGTSCVPGAVLGEVQADLRVLLKAERTILNFLQRMSGVATHTRKLVDLAAPLRLLDTRKTLPGWRILDKYAVRIGGAENHRFSLGDMVLVKNNHVDACRGGMREALTLIKKNKPPYLPFEVEVRNLEELSIALDFSPTIIMLDNFSNDEIKNAIALVGTSAPRPLVEVSGGINEERFPQLQELGIDFVSMGALTHQATSVDISFRITRSASET